MSPNRIRITLVLMAGLLLAACAGRGLRDQPPFVTLNKLELQGAEVVLDLGVRNVNSVALMLDSIRFSVTLDDESLAVYNAPSAAMISASGTENLRFRMPATNSGQALLEALGDGRRDNLAYRVDGEITVQDGIPLEITRNGYLYRVPGRPGEFR